MGVIGRLLAYAKGQRMIRLAASPREGGYIFVNSPDLPGFSVMLHPGELESFDSMAAALSGPIEEFVTAECRSLDKAHHARVTGMDHDAASSQIYARLCAA